MASTIFDRFRTAQRGASTSRFSQPVTREPSHWSSRLAQHADAVVAEEVRERNRQMLAEQQEQEAIAQEQQRAIADQEAAAKKQQAEAEKQRQAAAEKQKKDEQAKQLETVDVHNDGLNASRRAVSTVDREYSRRSREASIAASNAYEDAAQAKRDGSPDAKKKAEESKLARQVARDREVERLEWERHREEMDRRLDEEDIKVSRAKKEIRAGGGKSWLEAITGDNKDRNAKPESKTAEPVMPNMPLSPDEKEKVRKAKLMERREQARQQSESLIGAPDEELATKAQDAATSLPLRAEQLAKREQEIVTPITNMEARLDEIHARNKTAAPPTDGRVMVTDNQGNEWHPDIWNEYQLALNGYQTLTGNSQEALKKLKEDTDQFEIDREVGEGAIAIYNHRQQKKNEAARAALTEQRKAAVEELRPEEYGTAAADLEALDAEYDRAIEQLMPTLQSGSEEAKSALDYLSTKYEQDRQAIIAGASENRGKVWDALAGERKRALDELNDFKLPEESPDYDPEMAMQFMSEPERKAAAENATRELARRAQNRKDAFTDATPAAIAKIAKDFNISESKARDIYKDVGLSTENWDADVRDISKQARVLSDGRVVVNPRVWVDPEQYEKAVNAADATPKAKESALAILPELRRRAADDLIQAVSAAPVLKEMLDSLPGATPEEKALAFQKKMREDGAWRQIANDTVNAAGAGIAESALGVLAALAGNIKDKTGIGLADKYLEDSMLAWSKRSQAYARAAQEAQTGPIARGIGKLGGAVVSTLPSLVTGKVFNKLGAGMNLSEKALQAFSMSGAATGAAAQTGGSTYSQGLQAYRDQGMDPMQARREALTPAILSAISTGAITKGFGAKGVEAMFRSAEGREAVKRTVGNFLKQTGAGAVSEGAEELTTELVNAAIEVATFNPELSARQVIERALEAGALGAVLGGGFESVQTGMEFRDQSKIDKLQGEALLAASDAEIDNYQPVPGVDPQGAIQALATARIVRDIAQGTNLGDLTDQQLALVGIKRDAKGELKNAGANPLVKLENGNPIIRQEVIDQITERLPLTGRAIGMSEVEARQYFAQKSNVPQNPASGNASGTQPSTPTTPAENQAGNPNVPQDPLSQTSGATPTGETWSYTRDSGEVVTVPRQGINSVADASTAIQQLLPAGETVERSRIVAPHQQQRALASRVVSDTMLPENIKARANQLGEALKSKGKTGQGAAIKLAGNFLAKYANRYGAAFSGIRYEDGKHRGSGGVLYDHNTGELVVDTEALGQTVARSGNREAAVRARIREEALHHVIARAVGRERTKVIWDKLPGKLKKLSMGAYEAAALQSASDAKGGELTDAEVADVLARISDEATKRYGAGNESAMRGDEFLRQLLSKEFFNEVTEVASEYPGLAVFLKQILDDLVKALGDLASYITNSAARKEIEDARDVAAELARELGLVESKPAPSAVSAQKQASEDTKPLETKAEESLQSEPETPAKVKSFKTAKGSSYTVNEDGTTERVKAARPEHPGDEGKKERSARTVYVHPETAKEIGMWQTMSNSGKRLHLKDGKIILSSINPATGQRGRDNIHGDDSFTESPSIGAAPLELWQPNAQGMFSGTHPGNAIVEIDGVTSVDINANDAATSPINDKPQPTEAQREAGNYAKGHVTIGGLKISIENPEGSTRSGTDASGNPWSVTMQSHYGYILRTEGEDGDHVDVFIKPGTPEDYAGKVFVIDQMNPDGSFDEHKVVIGAKSAREASDLYHANYAPGWEGMGAMKAMTWDQFSEWVKAQKPEPAEKESPQVAEKAPEAANSARVTVGTATPNGARATVEWDVVDASELADSVEQSVNENQTRQRQGDRLSDEQRLKIASNPDTNLLGDFPTGMNGAPIMDGGKVIAGNGRMGGILLGYGSTDAGIGKKFTSVYKPFVLSEAQRLGLGDKAAGMNQPVLVRRVVSYDSGSKQDFIDQNNPKDGGILRESKTEEGLNDARAFGPKLMADMTFRADGSLTADSVVGATMALEKANRAPHRARDGSPDVRELTRRVQQAYLAGMAQRVGKPIEDLVALLDSDKGKRLMGGVLRAAPELAGFPADLSLDQALIDTLVSYQRGLAAVESVQMASMKEWAENRRGELLADGTPESNALLEVFVEADAKPAVMRDFFEQYVRAAGEESYRRKEASQSDDMFGEPRQPVPVSAIIARAREGDAVLRGSPLAPSSRIIASPSAPRLNAENAVVSGAGDVTIRAFHGTPHKVDKFTTEKVGSGEGAQAYGWGLYFAENQAVAESYRRLARNDNGAFGLPDGPVQGIAVVLSAKGKDGESLVRRAYANLGEKLDGAIAEARAAIEQGSRIYEVELTAPRDSLIDWDLPWGSQSRFVQDALIRGYREMGMEDPRDSATPKTGQWIYKDFVAGIGGLESLDAKAASEYLSEIGIRGIRFLDQGSRDQGGGTRNYVMFRDSDIKITHENGKRVKPDSAGLRASPAAPFVVTPELDAAYADAVSRNYIDSAQAMVDQVAKARGYNQLAYHGTKAKQFTKFDERMMRDMDFGFFFSDNPKTAEEYKGDDGRVIKAYLKAQKPYRVTYDEWTNGSGLSPEEAFAEGNDSYVVEGMDGGNTWIVPTAQQIKSAEAVVRDDKGNVIPLSWRFNPDLADLRYSPAAPVVKSMTPMYHGTRGMMRTIQDGDILYMTTDPAEAKAFSEGVIPGTGRGQKGTPKVLEFLPPTDGTIADISDEVSEAIMEGESVDDVVKAAYDRERASGDHSWLMFEHPSTISDGEFKAYIPLYPEELMIDDDGEQRPASSPAAPERDADPDHDIDAEEIAALMAELESDMPSVNELEWLTAMAMGENPGERSIGNPDVASLGDDPETRQRLDAVRLAYDLNRDAETREQWATAAKDMLENDPQGVKLQLLEAAAEGRALDSPEMVMAAKILIPEMTRQAWLTGDKKLEREAQMLAYAYAKAGTEQARAFAARFDPHQTPGQRRQEYLAKLLYTPDPKVRADIEKAPTPAEKRRRIASLERQIREARNAGEKKQAATLDRELRAQRATPDQMEVLETENAKRLQNIERALKNEGLSVDDLFEGRATVRLKLGKIVADTLGESDERRTKAIDLILHGWPDVEIARATGFSRQQVEEISRSLTPKVVEDLLVDLFQRGYTMEDLGVTNLAARMAASPAAVQGLAGREGPKMTPEQAREMARKVTKLLVPTARQRNSGKWKKVKRKGAPSTTTSKPQPAPRDVPFVPEIPRTKQDVMIFGMEALSPEEQQNINRPRQPGTDPIPADSGVQGKLDIPRTGPVPSDMPVSTDPGTQGKLAIPRTGPIPTDRPVSTDPGRQQKLAIKTGPDAPDAPLPTNKEMRQQQGKQQKLKLDPETDEFVPFDPEDPVQSYRIQRVIDTSGSDILDKGIEYWVNGLLSGPQTQIVNISGNTASAVWDMTAQRGMELIANSLVRDPSSAQWGEMRHLIRGIAPGIVKGFSMARQAFDAEADVTSDAFLDEQAVFGEGGFDKSQRIKAAIGGKTGRIIRIPGRLLMAMDAFFKTAIGTMEVGAQAYRIGKAMGHAGAELENFIAREAATPGSASWIRAMEKARELTFTQDIKTNEQGGHAMDNAAATFSKLVNANRLSRFIFPFIRTPYNIFKMGLRKTPLGSIPMLAHAARATMMRKPGESFRQGWERGANGLMVKELAEQTIAYMLLAGLWHLAEGGDDENEGWTITGGRPGGRETSGERDLQSRLQGGSYQVMHNGKPVFGYGRIEPAATIVGSMVDAIRMIKSSRTPASKFGALLGSTASQIQQKTFTQGFAGLADTTAALVGLGKDAAAETAVENARDWLIDGVVPNLVRQTARNADEFVRNRKASSPGHSALPSGIFAEPLIDPYGREMEKDGSVVSRLIYPQPLQTEPHPGDKMLDAYAKKNPDEAYHPLRSTMAHYRYEVDKERKEFSDPEKTAYDKIRGLAFDQLLRDYFSAERTKPESPRDPVKNPTEEDIEEYKKLRSKAGREAKQVVRAGGWKERLAELEQAQKSTKQ